MVGHIEECKKKILILCLYRVPKYKKHLVSKVIENTI